MRKPLVCLVDDDLSARESGAGLMRSAGLRVEAYDSAASFLHRASPEVPACLVLDVSLPGVSGMELQKELARGASRIPIIFVTGHDSISLSARAIEAGAHEFFTKPYEPDALLDSIQSAIALSVARA